jgi:competence protein ComEC
MNKRLLIWCGILLSAILALGAVPAPVREISMLDIGQGDSLLFQDGTQQMLIDGGPGADVLTRLAEEMPLMDRKIDVMVATHFDRDHIEGLVHVLSRYDVGMVLLPRYVPTTDLGREFLDMIAQRNIPYRFGWYGQRISLGMFQFRVMSPIPGSEWERLIKNKSNNASIIMRADAVPRKNVRPISFLLTGDAESVIERQLLSSIQPEAFDVDVLKVGHHGSKTSTTQEFVQAASPRISWVSVGADNTYGHPTNEVLSRLTQTRIFRTDQDGTVSFLPTSSGWNVACGKKTYLPFAQHSCIQR